MFTGHGGAIATKAGYALGCVVASLIMVTSGFAYYVKSQVASIGGSNVISGGPEVGAMNILLMGLESRTYWSGEPLPRGLEDIMHIGSVGGNATNTLILLHIFAGGQKAVAFSIPRDDWVDMYGTNGYGGAQGKIDQAYGFALAERESQLANAHLNQDKLAYQGNEAGRLAEIQTVQALTGVHIDHFAELNLDGFYQLAKVFNGIEVCVKSENGGQNLTDANSGARLKVGYQHLDAAQALAFVRERDNLINGDLDRTHRQQAVIDYVIWKLRTQGILADLGELSSLLTVAKQYLITDRSFNPLDFISEMKSLTGKNLTFSTLPITGYQTIDGQSVNVVNTAYIKKVVNEAFYPPATPAPSAKKSDKGKSGTLSRRATTVDVYNGGNAGGLAGDLSRALVSIGYKAGKVGSIPTQSSTEVRYGTGAAANAAKIAGYFKGVTASPSSTVAAGHVEVLLGTDVTSVPAAIASRKTASSSANSSSADTAASSPKPSPTSSALNPAESNGANGGAVTVNPNAPYGIPCVY